ncbi:BamA/TamA family outer membrane protein [Planctomicrobium piriforme]|uniref:POTRA domain-containing protein n=1 Tax=Planctomicrobium piriforme TaxID=1576369 RepID=A0A1I3NMR1_9PLAN|nr:hypothetical protein [Planctomicrobium piriforme]SFJ10442.1 hypothetical protein SAMN05421753_115144 [Planctomicrobium piriforme]
MRTLSILLFLFLAIDPIRAGVAPLNVGKNFSFDSILILGVDEPTALEIRQSLKTDIALFSARRPEASTSLLMGMIRRDVHFGFHRWGYKEVSVECRWDAQADRIVLQIDQGPRYSTGEVTVHVESPELQQSIIDALTKPQPSLTAVPETTIGPDGKWAVVWRERDGDLAEMLPPLWVTGSLLTPDASDTAIIHQRAVRACANVCYPFAKLHVQQRPNPVSRTIQLFVEVSQTGPPLIVSEIHVKGTEQQYVEDILDRLGFRVGDTITAVSLQKARNHLWNTGCFRTISVETSTPLTPSEPAEVIVDVVDFKEGPILGAPLTLRDEIAARMSSWVCKSDHEYFTSISEIQFQNWIFLFATTGDNQILADATNLNSPDGDVLREIALFCTDRQLQLIAPQDRVLFQFELPEKGNFKWTFHEDGMLNSSKPSHQTRMNWGMGWNSLSLERLMKRDIWMSPMAAYRHLQGELIPSPASDGSCEVTEEGAHLVVERSTGRVVEFDISSSDAESELTADLAFFYRTDEPEGIQRLQERLIPADCRAIRWEAGSATQTRHLICQSLGRFAFTSEASQSSRVAALVRWAEKVSLPLSQFSSQMMNFKNERFSIPNGRTTQGINLLFEEVLPAGSIPDQLVREIYLAFHGLNEPANELQRLLDSAEHGPLTLAMFSYSVSFLDAQTASQIADLGLDRLDESHFRSDLDEILGDEPTQPRPYRQLVQSFRQLSAAEIAAILKDLVAEQDVALLTSLANDSKVPDAEYCKRTLCSMWEPVLKSQVERLLTLLRDRSRPGGRVATNNHSR